MDSCKFNISSSLSGICLLAILLFSCSSQIDEDGDIYSFKEFDIKFGKFTMYCDGKIESNQNNQNKFVQYKDTTIAYDSINTINTRMKPYNFDWGVKFVKTLNKLSEIVVHINNNKTLNLHVNHTSNFSCIWQFVIWEFSIFDVPYQTVGNVIKAELKGMELSEKLSDIHYFARYEEDRIDYYKHDKESTGFIFSDQSYLKIELK